MGGRRKWQHHHVSISAGRSWLTQRRLRLVQFWHISHFRLGLRSTIILCTQYPITIWTPEITITISIKWMHILGLEHGFFEVAWARARVRCILALILLLQLLACRLVWWLVALLLLSYSLFVGQSLLRWRLIHHLNLDIRTLRWASRIGWCLLQLLLEVRYFILEDFDLVLFSFYFLRSFVVIFDHFDPIIECFDPFWHLFERKIEICRIFFHIGQSQWLHIFPIEINKSQFEGRILYQSKWIFDFRFLLEGGHRGENNWFDITGHLDVAHTHKIFLGQIRNFGICALCFRLESQQFFFNFALDQIQDQLFLRNEFSQLYIYDWAGHGLTLDDIIKQLEGVDFIRVFLSFGCLI